MVGGGRLKRFDFISSRGKNGNTNTCNCYFRSRQNKGVESGLEQDKINT